MVDGIMGCATSPGEPAAPSASMLSSDRRPAASTMVLRLLTAVSPTAMSMSSSDDSRVLTSISLSLLACADDWMERNPDEGCTRPVFQYQVPGGVQRRRCLSRPDHESLPGIIVYFSSPKYRCEIPSGLFSFSGKRRSDMTKAMPPRHGRSVCSS